MNENTPQTTPPELVLDSPDEAVEISEEPVYPDMEEQLGGYLFLEGSAAYKAVLVIAAIALALASFFVIAPVASSPETHQSTIETLDSKKETVLMLIAASTATSAAVTAIPDDVGTPIAEKLVDLSGDFLIVLTAIYLEKYLLTVFGLAAFQILIPLGCLAFALAVLVRKNIVLKKTAAKLSAKLALFGVAIFLVVPVSVATSGMIENTYQSSVNNIVELSEETVAESEEAQAAENASQKEDNGVFGFLSPVVDTFNEVKEQAQSALNGFIEALAVMIVTSCVIPVLVLVFFLWLAKAILGVNIDVPMQMLQPRAIRRLRRHYVPRP